MRHYRLVLLFITSIFYAFLAQGIAWAQEPATSESDTNATPSVPSQEAPDTGDKPSSVTAEVQAQKSVDQSASVSAAPDTSSQPSSAKVLPAPQTDVAVTDDHKATFDTVEDEQKEDRKKKDKKDKDEDTWPKMKLKARLMTGWEMERQDGRDREQHFFLQQARIRLKAEMHKRLYINISADLSDAIRPETGIRGADEPPYLRNAYFNLRIRRVFQIRVGRFKRPFSRLENTNTGSLPFRGRGLSNDLIIEESQFGDRAIGMMFWGEIRSIDLQWFASASNPDWDVDRDNESQGVDAIFRLEYEPLKWLSVGVNYEHKLTDPPDTTSAINVDAVGGDFRLKLSDFRLVGEAIYATQPNQDTPGAMGLIAYTTYNIKLSRRWDLQPTLFGEYADADTDITRTEAVRAIIGCNILWRKDFRILPQVEIIRPLGTQSVYNPWVSEETYYLLVSLQI